MDDNTRIFAGAYDDEDVGGQADLNNLETTMNVSSKRINKDHPIELIIGELHLALLTRRMSQQNLKQHCLVIQALEDPSWIEAMQEELLQFELQNVWTLVDLPNGKRAIGTKWVFRNKKDDIGIVVRHKARLMDVKSAFLYGTIEEEVYVCQPPRFIDSHFPDKVYMVEKSLYGLHQPPGFDVDSLSISMNYVPVVARNQTNGIAGTRDNIVADVGVKSTDVDESAASIKMGRMNKTQEVSLKGYINKKSRLN
ncbi:putative ribonuclease H-like domain-containing protein, partial [Tanacetum coccineum]